MIVDRRNADHAGLVGGNAGGAEGPPLPAAATTIAWAAITRRSARATMALASPAKLILITGAFAPSSQSSPPTKRHHVAGWECHRGRQPKTPAAFSSAQAGAGAAAGALADENGGDGRAVLHRRGLGTGRQE